MARFNSVSKRQSLKVLAAVAVSASALVALTGCEVKSFIDPSEVGRYDQQPLMRPILRKLDTGIEEPNDDWASATDPIPADFINSARDYQIGVGDALSISVSDIQAQGQDTVRSVRVSDSGTINLPLIDELPAVGKTEAQLQRAIKKAYADANLVSNALVTVSVVEARAKTFTIYGAAAGAPGEYQIVKEKFTLLDALTLARNAAGEFIYVVRKENIEAQELPPGGPGSTPLPDANIPVAPPTTNPGVDVLTPRTQSDLPQPHVARASQAWRIDLLQPRMLQTAAPASTETGATTQPAASEGRYIILDGKPVLVGGTVPGTGELKPVMAAPTTTTMPAVAETSATPATSQPFTFQDLTPAGGERVIRIPLNRLNQGDLKFNIYVRPGDTIIAPGSKAGFYYMGGHVQRTGAYQLSGSTLTLKQAIIAAGMLDGVAIPQRTDIIRRIGTDREVWARVNLDAIFEGKQPDIFLKPEDTVMVGTNFFAPFIAAIRNGFRFSYGFGFFYDKNFNTDNNNNNNN